MLFELGRTVATATVLAALRDCPGLIQTALQRHARGDWSEFSEDDRQANDLALAHGARLLGACRFDEEPTLWVLTEADRRATTVMLRQDD